MKKLWIFLLLVSPLSFADWGDVYYCQMTSMATTDKNGDRHDWKKKKFKFKLDKDKNEMVFGANSLFPMPPYPSQQWVVDNSIQEEYGYFFEASSEFGKTLLVDGKLIHSLMWGGTIHTVTADCDKF